MKTKEQEVTGKKPFTTPKLTVYGNMSWIVQGGTGATVESKFGTKVG